MGKKILVCDDEKHIVKIIEFNLKRAGFEVYATYDGTELVEFLNVNSFKPDVIVLDVMMPKMTGFECCDYLKESEEFKDIPIILLTAKGQEFDKDKGIRSGADYYMTKPFSPKGLLTLIEEIFGGD